MGGEGARFTREVGLMYTHVDLQFLISDSQSNAFYCEALPQQSFGN